MCTKEWKRLLLIISIFIAACIETDIYLPAFTDMMAYFSISEEAIQGILTWNFIGICFSGPLYGPISDSLGRKRPLMVALGLFLLGSILTIFAQNFEILLVGRILQGLGSGGCFTLGTAVLFDSYQQSKAFEALNRINTIVPFIMAGAPMLGGYLNYMYGFRSNFIAIAICVLISFLICWFYFDETLPAEKRSPLKIKQITADFITVFTSIPLWQTVLIVSLVFACYIAFLSTISVLFVIEYGISKQMLPLYQAALLGAWLAANLTSKKAIQRWGGLAIKKAGTFLFGIGGIGLVPIAYFAPESSVFLTVAMMLFAIGANWTQGLYFPEGMELFPQIRGVAASLLTSARLLISAVVVGFASILYNSTVYPIVGIIFSLTLISIAIIICYERKKTSVLEAAAAMAVV